MDFDLLLHPLAILSISDHKTRAKYNNIPFDNVVGVLLGIVSDSKIEICHAFDTLASDSPDKIDHDFLDTRTKLYKEIFPSLSVIGWYAMTNGFHETQQMRMKTFGANAIFLSLIESNDLKRVPVHTFRVDENLNAFLPIQFSVKSTDPEHITMNNLDNSKTNNTPAEYILPEGRKLFVAATSRLIEDLDILESLVKDAQDGKRNEEALRKIKQLCCMLTARPSNSSANAADAKSSSQHDDFSALLSLMTSTTAALAVSTKALSVSSMLKSDLVEKQNIYMSKMNLGRRRILPDYDGDADME